MKGNEEANIPVLFLKSTRETEDIYNSMIYRSHFPAFLQGNLYANKTVTTRFIFRLSYLNVKL